MAYVSSRKLFDNEAITGSTTEYSTTIDLAHIADQGNFSAAMEATGSGATFTVAYEVSTYGTDWITPSTAADIVTGLTTTGTAFVVDNVVVGTTTTVSGAHGLTSGDQVRFSGFSQDSSWRAALQGVYAITVTDTSTFTVAVDTSALAAYTTTTSGQIKPVKYDHISFAPVLAPYMRIKVTETAGNTGNFTMVLFVQ